jgi:hypothetical protein
VHKPTGVGVENRTKSGLDGWSLWTREKHKFPAGEQGYFHLEAHQVLRLVYILTFTMLNTQGQGHVSVCLYEGSVVLLAKG